MADDPQPPALPPAAEPPAGGRSDDAATPTQDELRRAHRLVVGSEGAYWERNLVTGEMWYSGNFFSVLGIDPTTDRNLIHASIHPDDKAGFEYAYQQAVDSLGLLNHALRYCNRQGHYRWARTQARVWPGADGKAERMIGMVTDIHEDSLAREELLQHRRRLQQMVEERTARLESALAEAKRQHEEAERANEAKSVFLAHMSHEIRTPLNGVLGLNELALREARSEQQRRYLKLALQSGRGLLDMLNGVLDFSRLVAGAALPQIEPFDLADLLAASLQQVMPQARAKGLVALYDYVGPVTAVLGDAQRIQQIAGNLLTNGVKFTGQGHVAMRADVNPTGPDGCWAEIDFSDTGAGMTFDVAARVFEPFVQGDESLARRHGGTGLGLSIARGLAESMGGSLKLLHTAPGEGSCFRLALPLGLQSGSLQEQRPEPGHAWLVYTRPMPAQWLAARFERLGWRSDMLNGLDSAVARAAEISTGSNDPPDDSAKPPQLVMLAESSIDFPAALFDLRKLLPQTPIVLLVRADWNQPHIEAAARANDMPLAFMPLTPTALTELLSASGPRPAPPDSALGDLAELPGSGADVLIAEDNPVNQLIITEMVASLGLRPRLVENGAQAVSACRSQSPNLVLMDLQMPEVDGLEATRQLCELQRLGEVAPFPIVALTAHATPQDRERCIAAGMQGFLTKPVSLGLLRTELRRWVVV